MATVGASLCQKNQFSARYYLCEHFQRKIILFARVAQ